MTCVMIRDFAQSLFASSFWDEWDNIEGNEDLMITEGERLAIRRKYHDRLPIDETITVLFSYYQLDLENYIPSQFVEELVKAIDKHWTLPNGDSFSMTQLYARFPEAAWGAIASQVGMGISPGDDPQIEDLFKTLGITELSSYQEIPSSWDGVVAIQNAIIAKRDKEIYYSQDLATRLAQWHDGMDAIYALSSCAIAGMPVRPDLVQAATELLDQHLIQVRENDPHDESVEELMSLIEELLEPLSTLSVA